MYIAQLVSVLPYGKVPEKYRAFVTYKAEIDRVKTSDDAMIAILRIGDTESYHVLFLDAYLSIDDIEEELEKINVRLSASAREVIQKYIDKE